VRSTKKKKKKREEQLSRTADAELAEISLEQQVLREMVLSQQPAEDKASQSSSLKLIPIDSSSHSSVG